MFTKYFTLFALMACVFATEEVKDEQRVKKDVILGTLPYAYNIYPSSYSHYYAYDDGKYYPGKYEKAYVAPAAYHVPTYSGAPAVSAYSAVPAVSTYSAVPSVSTYSAFSSVPAVSTYTVHPSYAYNYGGYVKPAAFY